jgi:maltooligosyltrehalose trehalohydrolase
VRRGRREEFAGFEWADEVPDPLSLDTFTRSRLEWGELDDPPRRRLVDWHRDLLALRRAWPELTDGRRDLVSVDDVDDDLLQVRRGRLSLLALTSERRTALPSGEILLSSFAPRLDADRVEGPGALICRTS